MPLPPYRGLIRTAKIPPCVVSLDDVRRLYADLNARTIDALDRHLRGLVRPPDMQQDQFDEIKRRALDEGGLTVTVQGAGGEQIIAGSAEEGLAREKLPEKIQWVVFDSAAAMKMQNVSLMNRFTLRLDFTEPPGFHAYDPWDQPTPNTSQIEVIGSESTWVTAVYETTLAFFRTRGRRRAWLHSHVSFNTLNWLVGFPAAFWIAYRADNFAGGLATATALRGAIDLYVFLVALLVFRGIIWTLRWLFPVIELEGTRSTKANIFVLAVLSSIVGSFIYDVVRTLLRAGRS
jgi:hypothetical protein